MRALEEFQKLFGGETGLLNDGLERPALEILAVVRNGNTQPVSRSVFQDVMAPRSMVNKKNPLAVRPGEHPVAGARADVRAWS